MRPKDPINETITRIFLQEIIIFPQDLFIVIAS